MAAAAVDAFEGSERRRVATWDNPLAAEQDRWFLWVPVFFGAGIAIYFALPDEPDLLTAVGLAMAACIVGLIWRTGLAAVVVCGALVATGVGFAAAKIRTELVSAPVLSRPLDRAAVSGFVTQVAARPDGGPRVVLDVTEIAGLARSVTPHRVRIRMLKSDVAIAPGQHVRILASLVPPPRPALPGGFDFARAAYFSGLGAVGFSYVAPQPAAAPRPMGLWLEMQVAVAQLRAHIGARVRAQIPGETGAIITALITGERGGISEETNAAFRDSGLLHILSISGLHMAIMGGFIFAGLRFLLALWPAVALRYPIKKWAAAGAIVAASGYLLISGGALATIRAFIMITIAFAAIMLDRPAIALRNVALAALIILAIWPESLMNPGFQMSFAAVVALVACYEALRDRRRGRERAVARGAVMGIVVLVCGIALTTIVASAAVAPIAIFHFHRSQQFALLANVIAVPIVNLALMPAALFVLLAMPFGLEALPLAIMAYAVEAVVWTAKMVAALPGAVAPVAQIPLLAFALVIVGGLWLAIWRRTWRFAGLAVIACGIAVAPLRAPVDVYVGAEGKVVAFRGRDDALLAMGRGGRFDLSRWLQADGDGREAAEVMRGAGRRCDLAGCIGQVRGKTIALSRHPRSLIDDCRRAKLVVASYKVARRCAQTPVIDWYDLVTFGNAAIILRDLPSAGAARRADRAAQAVRLEVRYVDAARGNRPWVLSPTLRWRALPKPATSRSSRPGQSSQPSR